MLACTNQIEILSLNLIHHGIHLGKTHNACHYIAADHERRYTVSESPVNHEISCIGNHRRMEPGDISHQIIEAVSGNFSGAVQINSVKSLHDLCMIRDFKVRNYGFAVFLNLNILAVVFSNWNTRIDDIGNRHHNF